ncbi:MAG: MoaD family protein [Candidatus Bathyarchaeota archaeon]
MTVRFFASLRELVSKKMEVLEFTLGDVFTVEDALSQLSTIYGQEFSAFLFNGKTGGVKDHLTLLLNGRNIENLDGLKTQLMENDVLAILPPVGGG